MSRAVEVAKKLGLNVLWGVALGLGMALYFCCVAVLFRIIGGPEVFEGNYTTFGRTLLGYLLAGFLVGLVLGVLRPIARTWTGASVVGVIGVVITYSIMGLIMVVPVDWGYFKIVLLLGLLMGPPLGVYMRYRWPKLVREDEEQYEEGIRRKAEAYDRKMQAYIRTALESDGSEESRRELREWWPKDS